MVKNDTFIKSSVIGTATTIFFMTFSGEDTKTRPRDRSQHNGKVKLVLNFSTNRKHVIAPMHVVPLSTLGAMLITIIYKSAFSMMKVHKSTCLFIPSKITLITITYLPVFIRLVFFLNKGFLQYNRVAKTVKLSILYSFMK